MIKSEEELMKIINDFYDNAEFQELSISEARNTVINYGVSVEKYMSMFLAFLLDINDYQSSTSFGNTNNALSLQQKLNLFSDLGYIEKDEKKILKLFFEIRNQFAHNYQCNTFEYAIRKVKVNNNSIDIIELNEDNCRSYVIKLYEDIKLMFRRLRDAIYDRKATVFLLTRLQLTNQETINNLKKHPDFNSKIIDRISTEVGHFISKKYDETNETFRRDIKLDFRQDFHPEV